MSQWGPGWDYHPHPGQPAPPVVETQPSPDDYRPETPGPYTSPPDPFPHKPRRHGLLVALGALGGLTIFGLWISATTDSEVVQIPNSVVSPSWAATPRASAKPVEEAPKTIPGDGTWIVGTDIAPGRYRSVVPSDTFICSWKRIGQGGKLLDIGIGDPGQSMVITVLASDDMVEVVDCGQWKRVG